MRMTVKKWIGLFVVLTCAASLTACSSGGSGAGTSPPPAASVSPSPSPSATPDGAADGEDSGQSDPSPSPDASPANPANPSPDEEQGAADTAGMLKNLLALAKEGKAPGIDFAAHDGLIDDVEKAWGEADKTDAAGKGLYATYGKKHAVFGFNKGSQIFDVRSSDPKLRTLTLKQIEQTLGKPSSTAKNGDDDIYVYEANDRFQLKFIIPKSTGKVDHISVFSPGDSINNMAG